MASFAHLLAGIERPRAGRCAQVEDTHAFFQELGFVVDLLQLEDAAGRVTHLFRFDCLWIDTSVWVGAFASHGLSLPQVRAFSAHLCDQTLTGPRTARVRWKI